MYCKLLVLTALIFITMPCVRSQTPPAQDRTVPLYRVNVVERTVNAVNYQYRSGPTRIDFRGTVLMPQAKGSAVVESKKGRTEIEAKFEHVVSPGRYGHEYLTYVLWAVTPDGHARNLGEVLPGSSDKAHLHVTTGLQSFGLIVTAEPYSTVHQPSDVVVLENRVRPDTVGGIQPIQVKYDLLPRGQYTYTIPANAHTEEGPRVSMDRYQAILAVYEAQNAVQIARSAGAPDLASDVFQRAEQQFQKAQGMERQKMDSSLVVTAARQAAETAEDARSIAVARKQKTELERARNEAAAERDRRMQAEAEAQQAQAQAQAARAQLDQERARAEADRMQLQDERAQAQAQAEAAAAAAPPPPPSAPVQAQPNLTDEHARGVRMNLFEQLRGSSLPVLDTPRGLVVTVSDGDFRGSVIAPSATTALRNVASILSMHPGLAVEVDGNTDSPGDDAAHMCYARAEEVRNALAQGGVPAAVLTTRSLGDTRPLGPNTSPAARAQNRRVEIVISGTAIGTLPYWDKTYSIR